MYAPLVRSTAVVIAVTGALAWAPAATAGTSVPTPSASAATAETPAPDTGSVEITTNDPAGDVLPGAAFLLLDSAGREVARGKTDAQGKLTFSDLTPGIYRLKEQTSGSPRHEAVADQDVIVTPGATTRLMITYPFKTATVLLQVKDDRTGKPLPGATVNIGTGTSTLLTLTTGTQGTASGELPLSRNEMQFWAKEIKAPAGYDLYSPIQTFTATPGAPVNVTVINAKTATGSTPGPSGRPTHKPTSTPSKPDRPSSVTDGATLATSGTGTPEAESSPPAAALPLSHSTPKASAGSLAHTGTDATPWLIGGAGTLITAGGVALALARRSRTDKSTSACKN
ncbi:SpaA isopeptide-forming pilin-related protein [Streptomyces sp. NPDC091416]|uniref:SpaA isopeptide-forming pilin-related protein n=1 Tax=Streptomyces sp. NPDC091416 TaxID=3366003 RepID=UPI00382F0D61